MNIYFSSSIIGYFLYFYFKCYPLTSFPSRNSLSHPSSPCLMKVFLPTTTHSNLTTLILHWVNKPSRDQGHILPLMSYKAIICFICNWSLGSLLVYSLFGCLVCGSSGVSGSLILLFFLSGCNALQLVQSFSNSFIRKPMLNPIVVYKHTYLGF